MVKRRRADVEEQPTPLQIYQKDAADLMRAYREEGKLPPLEGESK